MKTFPMDQGSGEWAKIRLGKVTASEIDSLVSPEGKVRTGDGPNAYLYRKLSEKVLGFAEESGSSWEMEQGTIMQHEAIPWLEFTHDVKVNQVGFISDDEDRFGASPDGLIGEDGGVEVKCCQPAKSLQYLLDGVVPKEYRLQVQFSLYVTQRKWWYFLSYSRQWPQLLLRVEPDPVIQSAIKTALDQFFSKFDSAQQKIVAMRDAENAVKAANYRGGRA